MRKEKIADEGVMENHDEDAMRGCCVGVECSSVSAFEPHPFAVNVHQLQLEECSSRATLLVSEFAERGYVAQGRLSLAEPGVYLCPAPVPAEFYASFLKRKRLELTEKYQDLVTRQMLREERWLEYTVALLQELVEEESVQRETLLVESLQDIPRLSLCHMQLQMVSAQGTEGTVIFVEEMEREIRFRVMIFEEVQTYELLVSSELSERALAKEREEERLANDADARGCVGAAEWNARWLLEREEEKAFEPLFGLVDEDRTRIASLLKWRIVCRESDARFAIETEYVQALYPTGTDDRDSWDDHSGNEHEGCEEQSSSNSLSPVLAQLVQRHHLLCDELHKDVRRVRMELESASTVATRAFTLNCPVASDANTADHLAEEEEAQDEVDRGLIFFGHRFESIPPMRSAGEAPSAFDAATKGEPCRLVMSPDPSCPGSVSPDASQQGESRGTAHVTSSSPTENDAAEEGGDVSWEDLRAQTDRVAALWAAL